jgi:hypothetical protein
MGAGAGRRAKLRLSRGFPRCPLYEITPYRITSTNPPRNFWRDHVTSKMTSGASAQVGGRSSVEPGLAALPRL